LADLSRLSDLATSSRTGKVLAVLALLLGIGVTGLVWWGEVERERERRERAVLDRTGALAARIHQRLVAYEIALRGGASLFAATSYPTRSQWAAYVDALALDADYPGVQGIAFAQWLPRDRVAMLERSVRDEGFSEFRVWPATPPAAGDVDGVSAIVFIEPLDDVNRRALGFDMHSEEVRRQAMRASRDAGMPVLTGPVSLVQDTGGAPPAAVLLYVPLYRYGMAADSIEARRQALLGWVYAPFRPLDLVASITRRTDDPLLIRLLDDGSQGAPAELFRDAGVERAQARGAPVAQLPVEFSGRRWLLEAWPRQGEPFPVGGLRTSAYLATGLLISLLLFAVIWSLSTTRDRAHALAAVMTQALRRTNEALDLRVARRTAELVASNDRLRALAEAGLSVNLLPDNDARYAHLVEQVVRLVGCRAAILSRTGEAGSPTGSALVPVHVVANPPDARLHDALRLAVRTWDQPAQAGIIAVTDEALSRTGAAPGSQVLAVPVEVLAGRRLGMLHLVSNGAPFSAEDQAVVRQLAVLTAAALAVSEAAADERQARVEAERANASKDRFLAIVSHELRSPLQAILGWVGVLERREDPGPDLRKALRVIRRNAEAQGTLVDDLLDLARIEQGKLEIDRAPVDLAEIARSVCESLAQPADEGSVTIVVDAPTAAPVSGDALRLQQVVHNLVGNALKFTPAGGRIEVRVRADGGQQCVEVSDNGRGIAPGLLAQMFEPFSQGDEASRRRDAGLGLGLSLVRHIVELHGGEVRADSPGEGLGAIFTVRLPALAAPQPRAEPPSLRA
jgi:signal transduction histidine kinase/CHASE1-domain containing sensor protein